MNESDKVTFYLAMHDVGFASGMRQAEEQFKRLHNAANPAALESGFQRVRTAIAAVAGSYALAQLVRGMTDVHKAFAEAEAQVVAFNRATKAGGISAEGVALLREFADQMKRFGFDDEDVLSVEKVGLNLGFSAQQAREFARVAIDLGGPLGKVQEAAQALAMAHNGSARGLRQFGIYIDEATLKAEGLNAVFAKSDRLFGGAGTQMGTAAARARELATAWGNLKENLGALVASTGVVHFLKDLTTVAENMTNAILRLRGAAGLPAGTPSQMQSGHGGGFPTGMASGHGPGAPVRMPVIGGGDADEKAAKAAADRLRAEQESLAINAELARAGGPMQQVADYYEAMATAAEKTAQAGVDAMRARLGQGGGFDYRALMLDEYRQQVQAAAEPLADFGSALDEEAQRAQYRAQAQQQLDDTLAESARAGKEAADARTRTDMEAAQAAYMAAQALIGIGMAARSGNMGGVVSGIGSLAMMGAPLLAAGGPWAFGIGAGLSIVGGLMGDGQPRTEGGKARRNLSGILGGAGLSPSGMSDEQMRATGNWDAWQQWANMLTGSEHSGIDAAKMLASSLSKLNLSFDETTKAVAYLQSVTEDMTFAEAEMATARAGVLSIDTLTTDQLRTLFDTYAEGANRTERLKQLTDELFGHMEQYRKSGSASERERILKDAEKDRTEYIALVKADLAEKERIKTELAQAGLSQEQQAKIAGGVQESNYWLETIAKNTGTEHHTGYFPGSHFARIRNDEAVVPPEKSLYYARSVLAQRGGGSSITITVNGAVGDHREIARKLHRELNTLREFGEVNN